MRCWIALHISITTEPTVPAQPGAAVMDEAALQQALVSLALGFTPHVALVDEAVLLDVTGSLRLFGGLASLMQALAKRTEAFLDMHQLQAQLARAQGANSLVALGRLRHQARTSNGIQRVADLPLYTLTAARPHLDVLERIGCRHWGDLLNLPRDGMARRFGAGLLQALDRARGSAPDDYPWLTLPEHFEEKLELNALVTQAPALMTGVAGLLVKLQAWLIGRQSGLCALKLIWHLDKRRDVAPTGELEVRTAQPAQDLRHVSRLIAEHLAQQVLPAPVHALTLRSLVTESLTDSAAATASLLMEERRQGDSVVELVERLSARLGDAKVQAWEACNDHRPEQMQRWIRAAEVFKTRRTLKSAVRRTGPMTSSMASGQTEALYPTWLLPEPLQLQTVGNSPVYQGKLTRLAGPQRLEAAEWLLAEGSTARQAGLCARPWALRDYFVYRSQQGSLLWIYSERLGSAQQQARQRAWYLHGFFT
ncbi:DNA polymerase Y family protein [Polaromonas sp. YR568]|uniref:Y-family DNA polymerase n=1 Tax=Polaromonas sp. YR568 TaxID=1855301 RepID=UPI003137B2B2